MFFSLESKSAMISTSSGKLIVDSLLVLGIKDFRDALFGIGAKNEETFGVFF